MSRSQVVAAALFALVFAPACDGDKAEGPPPESTANNQPKEPEPVSTANVGDDGAGEKPEPEAPETEKPEPEKPAAEPIACGDKTCTPPEECLSIVGSIQGAPKKQECWIPCNDEKPCPEGMACTMIHDGPGQVCTKKGE